MGVLLRRYAVRRDWLRRQARISTFKKREEVQVKSLPRRGVILEVVVELECGIAAKWSQAESGSFGAEGLLLAVFLCRSGAGRS